MANKIFCGRRLKNVWAEKLPIDAGKCKSKFCGVLGIW
jgi:hypothetical protein